MVILRFVSSFLFIVYLAARYTACIYIYHFNPLAVYVNWRPPQGCSVIVSVACSFTSRMSHYMFAFCISLYTYLNVPYFPFLFLYLVFPPFYSEPYFPFFEVSRISLYFLLAVIPFILCLPHFPLFFACRNSLYFVLAAFPFIFCLPYFALCFCLPYDCRNSFYGCDCQISLFQMTLSIMTHLFVQYNLFIFLVHVLFVYAMFNCII